MPRRTIPLGAPPDNGILPLIALIVVGILVIVALWYVQRAPAPMKFP
jgi:hypothetical protein